MNRFASLRWRRAALIYAVLPLAYVASGALGLLLAVPPGYATAIFLPAGIAFGAMFLAGAASLPGTFFASLVLNLWVAYGNAHRLDWPSAWAAIIIASASTLQAGLGGYALRRALGEPTPLDNGRDVLSFLALPPILCLVSASLSLSGLWLIGVVHTADLFTSWATWWIGDTLGVLIVLPLMLVVAGEPRMLWRNRARFVAMPIVLFFALFVAIFIRVSRWENAQSLLEFRMRSQHLADTMKASLEEQAAFLEQLEAAFVTRHAPVTRQDFRRIVQRLLERFPMVQAVEWAPRVMGAERAPFESNERRETPGFAILEQGSSGRMRAAAARADYFPVTYIEPQGGNETALGFDLASDSRRRAAIQTSMDTGMVAASAPLRLVQEHSGQSGVLLVDAVKQGQTGPGVILIVLRMGTFTTALSVDSASALAVNFVDASGGPALFDDFPAAAKPAYDYGFAFGGRHYVVRTTPSGLYLIQHRGWESWALLVAGVLGTGLLGALLMLGTGQTHHVARLLDERTSDLRIANARLKAEMEEREQAQAALHQAQRLKAIGHLTGGIAHDFNNLLMVVNGSIERLKRESGGEKASRYLDMIRTATQRGESLTRQLLSFSQMRPLNPRIVDLVPLVRGMTEMLKQSLRGDIAIKIEVPTGICPVNVDPSEFELAILNLALNAQDAMPEGGALVLAVEPIRLEEPIDGVAGDCIAVSVRDTGAGIAPETMAHVFEPFFTTKEVGKGTGLGLSQVYGFAKQSGGGTKLGSAVGEGTTVTLYLPRSTMLPGGAAAIVSQSASVRGSGTVLVVEDNVDVGVVVTAQLKELGYRVECAATVEASLPMLESGTIDLVVSDILMPGGTSGLELARRIRRDRPQIAVLLITGYGGSSEDPSREGFVVLRKPFDTLSLSEALREASRRRGTQ